MNDPQYSGDFGFVLSRLMDEYAANPADDFDYLTKWASNAGISLEQLVVEILMAACEGDQFVKGRPVSED